MAAHDRTGDLVPRLLFTISVLAIAVGYGMFAWKNNWFPAPATRAALAEWQRLSGPETKRPHRVPLRHEKPAGATSHRPDLVAGGLTLISSYWPDDDWYPGVRLIDSDGVTLHHWPLRPTEIFTGQRQVPYSDATYVHGSYLFDNGDLLVNLEYLGLVRLNSCGEVLWTTDYATHHSIFRDEDGNFWVPGFRWIYAKNPRARAFPGIKTRFAEELILKVSPEGEKLKEISLLDSVYNSEYRLLLWATDRAQKGGDLIHLNDVEILSVEMARYFPMFEPGDILVSSNFLSLVAVLSPEGEIKWASYKQFYRQHDPNFERSGLITVYDNRPDGSLHGDRLGGSRLVAIDPYDNAMRTLYPLGEASDFFTSAGGKHQLLANGNRLVSELHGGRVFEISALGELVWEWLQQPYSDTQIAEVQEGSRYQLDRASVAAWDCAKDQAL